MSDASIAKDAFYLHFKHDTTFPTQQEAERMVKLYRKAAEVLAERFPVWMRRIPEFWPEAEFTGGELVWNAAARFSIADAGEPGLYFFHGHEWHRNGP